MTYEVRVHQLAIVDVLYFVKQLVHISSQLEACHIDTVCLALVAIRKSTQNKQVVYSAHTWGPPLWITEKRVHTLPDY